MQYENLRDKSVTSQGIKLCNVREPMDDSALGSCRVLGALHNFPGLSPDKVAFLTLLSQSRMAPSQGSLLHYDAK